MSLLSILNDRLSDNRGKKGKMYSLGSLVLLVIVGFMCGRNSVRAIERFGRALSDEDFYRLGFKRSFYRPSQATLCIQLQQVDVNELIGILSGEFSLTAPDASSKRPQICIDGKRLRATRDASNPNSEGIHILQVFAEEFGGIFPQKRLAKGENEITAMLDLLDNLDLAGKVVTGDAMFAQKHICGKIKANGGDYMFPLKDNQKSTRQAIERSLEVHGGKNLHL